MNERRETNTLQLNMTHEHKHEKKMHTGNSNNIKNVKKNVEFKIVQWKYCAKQIKLCCNPLMQVFLFLSPA